MKWQDSVWFNNLNEVSKHRFRMYIKAICTSYTSIGKDELMLHDHRREMYFEKLRFWLGKRLP